ncbi:MAG: hypothetical protein U0996_10425 [Planctomycetaceae bacterium]
MLSLQNEAVQQEEAAANENQNEGMQDQGRIRDRMTDNRRT